MASEDNAYWERALAAFEPSPFPDLTGLSSHGRESLHGSSVVSRRLQTPLSNIDAACHEFSCSFADICRAAWAKVLCAYVGETDVCFGQVTYDASSPADHKSTRNDRNANLLPFRIAFKPLSTNRAVLEATKKRAEDQNGQCRSRLEDILSRNAPEYSSLFDTLVFFDSLGSDGAANLPDCASFHDIDFAVICIITSDAFNDSLTVTLHCRRLFVLENDTHHVLDAIEKSIESVCFDPDSEALDFTKCSVSSQLSLSAYNTDFTPAKSDTGELLHIGIEKLAENKPNQIGLEFLKEDRSLTKWTFAELNQKAELVAGALHGLGLDVEDSVPICMPKSPSFYAAMLGVLKAGGAFTPFDPPTPEDRKIFMLEELEAQVVLTLEDVDMSWCENCEILYVDQILAGKTTFQNGTPRTPRDSKAQLNGANIAYNMYTSGSTGRPKAVSVEHRNAVQTAHVAKPLVPFDSSSRLLQFADTGFDMCYFDCFLAWTHGFCLCSTSQDAMFNDLTGVINKMEVTLLDLTPSMAATLNRDQVPTVQWLYCIGEAMPQELVRTWEGKAVNSYGPTEAAQCVTIFPVDNDIKSAVIGYPYSNTSFTVLQKHSDSIAPIFGAGELLIGGSQVARGYFNNTKMTEERFIQRDGQRVYKTGDLVRMLGNGTFEFIGRADDQVKIHGQRVELEEISHVLRRASDQIQTATTQILKADDDGSKQLVGFLVTGSNVSKHEQNELRAAAKDFASEHLPIYMIPNIIICIETLPLSSAGKANKKELTKIYRESLQKVHSEPQDDGISSSEWTPKAESIREVFSQVSGVPKARIQINTSIYELGLDSLSAIKLASELNQQGIVTTATDIREYPSIQELVPILDSRVTTQDVGHEEPLFDFGSFDKQHRANLCEIHDIDSTEIAAVRPCTALQAGMLAQSIHTDGQLYFNHLRYEFDQDIDLKRLQQAWDAVVEKYEILRSGFAQTDDPRYKLAMVTYRSRVVDLPIEVADDELSNSTQWYNENVAHIIKNLHEPAWKLRIEPKSMRLIAHHAIYDEETLHFFLRDVHTVYSGLRLSPSVNIEPMIAKILRAGEAESQHLVQFWQHVGKELYINRFPAMTPLRQNSGRHLRRSCTCSVQLSKLEGACRKLGVTMQAAGQASWAKLLSAYVGEDVVTFGTVVSGRATEDDDSLGFPCVSTVPTVGKTSLSNTELLKSFMKFNASVQRYQFTPLKNIQRWVDRPDQALFDTIFMFQKIGEDNEAQQPWRLVDWAAQVDFPISIEFEPLNKETLDIRIHFRDDLIPSEQADLMLKQLDHLLQTLLFEESTGSTFHSELYSITPAKEAELPSRVQLLHEFVENSTEAHPDRIALEFATELHGERVQKTSWTYQQLNEEGNRIANHLRQNNVKQGSIVGICFEKCPEASFAILGILKAGCSFLALDPSSPIARKKFIIEDSSSAVLITTTSIAGGFEEDLPVSTILIDKLSSSDTSTANPQLEHTIKASDLSYCLYTSGTTGTPKGCALTHENAVQAMLAFQRLYKWDKHSRWLQFAAFQFDVSVMEQYWSWSVGICVVSADRDLIFQDLAGTIRQLEITHIDLTPSLASVLDPEDVPSLCGGVFVTGGEMLKQEILERWGTTRAIHNGYGPTEATIGCTMFPRVPDDGKPSNIGPQFENVGTFVVNPDDTNVPVLRGAVGELCVSGKLVARGYLNRPELTEKSFIFIEGERCYRTGDLVRILHDNSFEFLGRADDQVKLRGQRLEIGEINHVIQDADPSIVEVCTLVAKHAKQQKEQLVSFVVAQTTQSSTSAAKICFDESYTSLITRIRDACLASLPGYMIPTHILPISRLPLSSNNKTDAHSLLKLYDETLVENLQRFSKEATETTDDSQLSQGESNIRKILASTVHVDEEEISTSSNLFQLGLDSISAIGFARALRDSGFSQANTSVVMTNHTVSRLAAFLVEGDGHSNHEDASVQHVQQTINACEHRFKSFATSRLGVKWKDVECLAPCTPLQEGMISRSLESDRPVYYQGFNFELNQDVNLDQLQTAARKVQQNVQILRTKFLQTEEGFIQVVLKSSQLPWTVEDVSDEDIDVYLDRKHHEWWLQNEGVDLTHPWEIVVGKTSERIYMALHIFHGLFDANSLPMLMQSLLAEYTQKSQPDYGPNFHDALSYGPLKDFQGAKSFWKEHLQPLHDIGASILTPLTSVQAEDDLWLSVSVRSLKGLEECRRRMSVSHQAVVQACWAAVLQHFFKLPVVLGMVLSGRSIDFDGAERVIGPMFNTLPFLPQIGKQDTWSTFIQNCHTFNSAVVGLQHTPVRDIQKWSREFRKQGSPLFPTLFVYQKQQTPGTEHEPIWTFRRDSSEVDYPLALEVEQTLDGSLNLTLAAQGYIADENVARQMLDKFEEALHQIISDPDRLISDSIVIAEVKASNGTNGWVHTSSTNGNQNGHWSHSKGEYEQSHEAQLVLEEVARLADMDSSELNLDSSILELGLDSIDAVKLSSRLKRSSGLQIPVSKIMRAQTIGGIASEASESTHSPILAAANPHGQLEERKQALKKYFDEGTIELVNVEQILPPTPLQEAMIAEMIKSDFTRYLNHDVLKLSPDIDLDTLKASFQTVVDNSTILRTMFREVDDPSLDENFAQLILQPSQINWRDTAVADEEQLISLQDVVRTDMKARFGQEPPLCLTFVKVRDKKQSYLILSIAHALYDGQSLSFLHRDVAKAYQGNFTPRPSVDATLSEILDSSNDEAQQFWHESLADFSPTRFPKTELKAQEKNDSTHRKTIGSEVPLSSLQAFCRRYKVTLSALTQTAWSCLLASYTKKLDVSYGVVLSGRNSEAANQVMFPTMNTVIVRTVIHASRYKMAQYMQETMAGISKYQHLPLRKAMSLAGRASGDSLFDTLFIYQGQGIDDEMHSGHSLYKSVAGSADVEYPVCVEAEQTDDTLIWRTACKDYALDSHETTTVLHQLDSVLASIVQSPDEAAVEFKRGKISVCGLGAFAKATESTTAPDSVETQQSDDNDSSWGQTESIIRQELAQVAKVDESEIKKGSSLFHLGLDSISAIKVSSQLKKRSILLPVSQIIAAGTVFEMAKLVDGGDEKSNDYLPENNKDLLAELHQSTDKYSLETAARKLGIATTDIETLLPATSGQVFLLSNWQNFGNFFERLRFRINGTIEVDRLKEAWKKLVEETPIIRTSFVATGDEQVPILQVVLKHLSLDLQETDSLEEALKQDSNCLVSPYLVNAFAQVEDNGIEFGLLISHALYDGVSVASIAARLQELCNEPQAQQQNTASFEDFMAMSSSRQAIQERKDFWSQYLKNASCTTIESGPDTPTQVELVQNNAVSQVQQLQSLAREHGTSVHAYYLASFATVYAKLINIRQDEDVILGVWLANRSAPLENLPKLIAPTVNVVPLRIRQPLSKDKHTTAQQIQQDLAQIGSHPNSAVGLWEIDQWTGGEVRPQAYVNLIHLPDSIDEQQSTSSGKITIEDRGIIEDKERVVTVHRPCPVGALKDNAVRATFVPSIQIDASIKGASMAIGLTAPESILNLDQAKAILKDLRTILQELAEPRED